MNVIFFGDSVCRWANQEEVTGGPVPYGQDPQKERRQTCGEKTGTRANHRLPRTTSRHQERGPGQRPPRALQETSPTHTDPGLVLEDCGRRDALFQRRPQETGSGRGSATGMLVEDPRPSVKCCTLNRAFPRSCKDLCLLITSQVRSRLSPCFCV